MGSVSRGLAGCSVPAYHICVQGVVLLLPLFADVVEQLELVAPAACPQLEEQ